MERVSVLKKFFLLGEAGMQYLVMKKGDKVEIQIGPFGNPELPIQITQNKLKLLDGKFDYQFTLNNKRNSYYLLVTTNPDEVEAALSFIVTKVLIYPKEVNSHFDENSQMTINDMQAPESLDISKMAITVNLSDEQVGTLCFAE